MSIACFMDHNLYNSLKESSLRSTTDFVNTYASNEDNIIASIESFEGIKSEFYCQDFYNEINTLKFLSIYSDFTSVFMLPHKVNEHVFHYYPPENPLFINRNITFPLELLKGFVPKPIDIRPGYTTQNDFDTKDLFKKLNSLIEKGRFMVRPIRTIMLHNDPSSKPNDGTLYYASFDTPNNDWKVKELNEKESFVIDNGLKNYQAKVLYKITLPYLNNVSIENLTKITDDETDLLGTFRATLKELMIATIQSENDLLKDIRNDKIRPQIETINRKFNSIKNVHKLSVGASVTAYTISLIALTTNFGVNFQTLFNTALGGSSLGILASEIKFQSEEDKLKDNPYFLLWKISKANSSKILKQF